MGMEFKTTVVKKQLRNAHDVFDDAASDALEEGMEDIFLETQVRVPKETTALMNTGKVEENPKPKHVFSRSIWYGEPGEGEGVIDYAAAVHEILDARHSPPTSAKYVEQPLIEGIDNLKEKLAEKMKEAVKEAFK